MTQLLRTQSIELDAMGRGSVRPAFTKATCGGRRVRFLAFSRARLIISYVVSLVVVRPGRKLGKNEM